MAFWICMQNQAPPQRTHRRKKHAHRIRKDRNGNATTNTVILQKPHYLAEIGPNQDPRVLKLDVKRHHCGGREDGYNIGDLPPSAACAHGDYSYIYDLYLEEI